MGWYEYAYRKKIYADTAAINSIHQLAEKERLRHQSFAVYRSGRGAPPEVPHPTTTPHTSAELRIAGVPHRYQHDLGFRISPELGNSISSRDSPVNLATRDIQLDEIAPPAAAELVETTPPSVPPPPRREDIYSTDGGQYAFLTDKIEKKLAEDITRSNTFLSDVLTIEIECIMNEKGRFHASKKDTRFMQGRRRLGELFLERLNISKMEDPNLCIAAKNYFDYIASLPVVFTQIRNENLIEYYADMKYVYRCVMVSNINSAQRDDLEKNFIKAQSKLKAKLR